MVLSEVRTAVERFDRDLNVIRRCAKEREAAAKRDLDKEAPALQRKIGAIRNRMTQLEEELNECRQEEDAAYQRLLEIYEAYDASVQHRRMVSALPDTQTLLDFILGDVSDCASPKPLSSTRPCSDIFMEVGHADDLALDTEKQSPSCLAPPASIPTSLPKRQAEYMHEKSGKRRRHEASAVALVAETVGNDGLYDDGNARCDHRTIQGGEGWSILGCNEHHAEFLHPGACKLCIDAHRAPRLSSTMPQNLGGAHSVVGALGIDS
ncbi:hypothetical protein CABS02_13784 [Colletotrichum abscissum]|uniref:Uncharacterized protein n=1 Tax=Colletotrichum abscissum TaxID=1671311 RepID=A0A9P9X2J5_9PEZI|nr:hypothetical protein CABS02_13784 [Colletotrichum abscissum]